MKSNIFYFRKIKFYNWSFNKILQKINRGGYLVAPAASSLSKIEINKKYHQSLINSDIAILDSGFFCLLLKIFYSYKVNKFSGYLFLNKYLNISQNKKILLIDPNKKESNLNLKIFSKKNIVHSYIAPNYKKNFKDKKLFKLIKKIKPDHIFTNIGGEKQEILAYEISKKFNRKYSIFCTGAAIGFINGSQAPINLFWDKIYLGWFIRFLYNPLIYFPRIVSSFKLLSLLEFYNLNKRS